MYQAELLHEVACILRTQHTNSPAAARTRQAAMDALRHFGAGGVDAYRQARQYPGGPGAPPSMTTAQRDPGENSRGVGLRRRGACLCCGGGGLCGGASGGSKYYLNGVWGPDCGGLVWLSVCVFGGGGGAYQHCDPGTEGRWEGEGGGGVSVYVCVCGGSPPLCCCGR